MLRVAVTGPTEAAVDAVVATWPRDSGVTVATEALASPTDLVTAARHHLVVGVAPGPVAPADAVDVWIGPRDGAALWRERIAPFGANLAAGRRAPRRRVAALVAPDPGWAASARRLVARISRAAEELVLRADHIGSTAVPGLPAKDLVDVQVVVRDLGVATVLAGRARELGLVDAGEWDAPDRTGSRFAERVLVDADPGRPVNVNLRPVGDPVWREALLFRDWLRADERHRDAYLAEKRRLEAATDHVDAYGDGKVGWIGEALAAAERWAASTDWAP